ANGAPVDLDDFTLVQPAEEWALGHAQLARTLGMEAAEPVVLDECEAERARAVARGIRDDVVVVAVHRLAGLELADLHREGHTFDAEVHGLVEDFRGARR